jgi:hypothetical protein
VGRGSIDSQPEGQGGEPLRSDVFAGQTTLSYSWKSRGGNAFSSAGSSSLV